MTAEIFWSISVWIIAVQAVAALIVSVIHYAAPSGPTTTQYLGMEDTK